MNIKRARTNIWLGKVGPYLLLKMYDLVGKNPKCAMTDPKTVSKEDSTRLKLPFPMTAFLAKVSSTECTVQCQKYDIHCA